MKYKISILLTLFSLNLIPDEQLYLVDLILIKYLPEFETKEQFLQPELEIPENITLLTEFSYPKLEINSLPLTLGFLDSDFFKGSRIFGFFQLYKERFLHFNSNLYLSELDPLLSQEERLITGKNVFDEEKEFDLFEEKNQKVLYEAKHSKKLRSGELHYMDHPKFGMLVKLTKAQKELSFPDNGSLKN